MNRRGTSALLGALLLASVTGLSGALTATPAAATTSHKGACTPSPQVLKANAVPVHGLSTQQVENATEIINAAAQLHVPERGQTLAVMTALEASSLGQPTARQAQGSGTLGLFGPEFGQDPSASPLGAAAAAEE